MDETLVNERILALLWTFFAGSALLLASIGLYGTVSHATSRRTAEIGIRMALGATAPQVLWLVMRESVVVIVAGVAAGIVAALASARWIASLLYGVSATDPMALASAVALLVLVTLLAAFVPARRASCIEPMAALRYE